VSEEGAKAVRTLVDSANTLIEIPKLTLTWASAVLVYDLWVLREYGASSLWLRLPAALGSLSSLVAVVGLAAVVTALRNIAAIEARELFSGKVPDPESSSFQGRLAEYARWYNSAKAVAFPAVIIGFFFSGATTLCLLANAVLV